MYAQTGAVCVPSTALAGVNHMLPYFGSNEVEIGFSAGKMRVDTTVFHNRKIVPFAAPEPTRQSPPIREQAFELA